MLTSTIFEIFFRKTIIEPEHSFPLENLIKMGGGGLDVYANDLRFRRKRMSLFENKGGGGIN